MHALVFEIEIVWLTVLILALAWRAARATGPIDRALALDLLSLVLVAEIAIFAVHRGRPGYLDVALVLGLLSFAQTVATARYAAEGRVTP